jgi:ribosomal protein S27AE
MNCKKAWNQKFMITNLNRSFVSKDYLNHRKQLLVEREISKLPDTMELATRCERIYSLEQKASELYKKITELNKKKYDFDVGDDRYYREYLERQSQKYTLQQQRQQTIMLIYELKEKTTSTHEKKKFIMGCTNPDCRGFLSASYKCDLCKQFTCPTCLEFIGEHAEKEKHTCNEDSVKTAEAIKKETKPCPNCGERIYKIDGCNQMWCSQCHTTFDWVSGMIDNGVIHNPHFFEYQQTLRDKADVNPNAFGRCNPMNVPQWYIFYNSVIYQLQLIDSRIDTRLTSIYRIVAHISTVEIPNIREKITQCEDTSYIRVDYILKKIDKKTLGSRVAQKDKARKKNADIFNIYELISNVGRETLHGLCDLTVDSPLKLESIAVEQCYNFEKLVSYCNQQFADIGSTYGGIVPIITEDTYMIQQRSY